MNLACRVILFGAGRNPERCVVVMPTLFLKLTKIWQRENGKFVDFPLNFEDVPATVLFTLTITITKIEKTVKKGAVNDNYNYN